MCKLNNSVLRNIICHVREADVINYLWRDHAYTAQKHKKYSSTVSEPQNHNVLFLLEVVKLTSDSVRRNVAFPLKENVTGKISI